MYNNNRSKFTLKISSLFFLVCSLPIGLAGCGHKTTTIETNIKEAYNYVREKNDSMNNALSVLSGHDKENKDTPKNLKKKVKREKANYNTTIESAPIYDFLAEEFFSLYIFSSVNYSLQYAYEPNGVNYEDKVYGNVTNELSETYRKTLKTCGGTTPFYLEFGKEGNDLTFEVDWLRKSTLNNLSDNYNFQGCTYVNGLIKRDENLNVTELDITSYTENDSHHISSSRFDFKNASLSLFTVSYRNGNVIDGKDLVESYNHGLFNYNKFKELKYTRAMVSTSAITDNYLNLDYEGYLLTSSVTDDTSYVLSPNSVNEELFEKKFNDVYKGIYNFPIRGDVNAFNYRSFRKVEFLDDVLGYGLDKTKLFIDSSNVAHVSYIEKETLLKSINEYLPKTSDENVKRCLNKLSSEINSIKDSDYRTTFTKNGCSFVASEGNNYWHNAYKGDDFYYCFMDDSSNGNLIIRFIGEDIESAVFNIRHRIDENAQPSRYENIEKFEPTEEKDFAYKTSIDISYKTCLDCGEEVPYEKYEIVYYGLYDENDERVFNVNSVPYREYSYRYDYELSTWKYQNSGRIYEYIYEKECGFIKTYEAQLECNRNTNYQLYPMYEDYYDYRIEKGDNKYTLTYRVTFINNWLKFITTSEWLDFIVTKVGDLSLHIEYKGEKYYMLEGEMTLESTTSLIIDAEYVNVAGFGISLSKENSSVYYHSIWGDHEENTYSYSYSYTINEAGNCVLEDKNGAKKVINSPIKDPNQLDHFAGFELMNYKHFKHLRLETFEKSYNALILNK